MGYKISENIEKIGIFKKYDDKKAPKYASCHMRYFYVRETYETE